MKFLLKVNEKYGIVLFALFFSLTSKAQVGINTTNPDTSAALHIVSKPNGQGLLIPRLTEAQRLAIYKPAKGLMVYDLSANLFYMNLDSAVHNWYVINPWTTAGNNSSAGVVYTNSVVTNVGIGTSTPAAKLDVNGDFNASVSVTTPVVNSNTVNVPGFPVNSFVPAGAIMMWSGTTAPAGWALCDGTSGTPDLRGRFVVGYDAGGSTTPTTAPNDGTTTNYGGVGNTGGENGHILLKTELPKHQHSLQNGVDLATSSITNASIQDAITGFGGSTFSSGTASGMTNNASNVVTHGHSLSGNSGNGTTDGLNNTVHENRPPYYVLAYIIKLP
jgi:microcystin-dependent protein